MCRIRSTAPYRARSDEYRNGRSSIRGRRRLPRLNHRFAIANAREPPNQFLSALSYRGSCFHPSFTDYDRASRSAIQREPKNTVAARRRRRLRLPSPPLAALPAPTLSPALKSTSTPFRRRMAANWPQRPFPPPCLGRPLPVLGPPESNSRRRRTLSSGTQLGRFLMGKPRAAVSKISSKFSRRQYKPQTGCRPMKRVRIIASGRLVHANRRPRCQRTDEKGTWACGR